MNLILQWIWKRCCRIDATRRHKILRLVWTNLPHLPVGILGSRVIVKIARFGCFVEFFMIFGAFFSMGILSDRAKRDPEWSLQRLQEALSPQRPRLPVGGPIFFWGMLGSLMMLNNYFSGGFLLVFFCSRVDHSQVCLTAGICRTFWMSQPDRMQCGYKSGHQNDPKGKPCGKIRPLSTRLLR